MEKRERERADACICDLPKASLERESMFIHFLPSFSSFFFLFPLVSLYFYIIFGRAKTLENRSFKIDTAGYKTIWSTDSLKIKKRHCEGNSPNSQILRTCTTVYTPITILQTRAIQYEITKKYFFQRNIYSLENKRIFQFQLALHVSFFANTRLLTLLDD